MQINLQYDGIKVDLNNISLRSLEIILVDNSTNTINFYYYIPINYDDLASFLEWLLPIFIFALQVFLSIAVIVLVVKIILFIF